MQVITLITIILIITGIWEKKNHKKNLNKIPKIVHVNGIRGKSSTTRLTAAALRADGLQVLAKTTGTAAKIIYPDGSEKDLLRHGPPSISEQKRIVQLAVKEKVDVLVIECMAISPEIQWSSEHLFLKADYTIITNIRNDHLDKMGSNLKEIAQTICLSLPQSAHVISAEKNLESLIKKEAKKRNNLYSTISDIKISQAELKPFKKTVFKENIACALKVASSFKINKKTALAGMYSVTADPGSLKTYLYQNKGRNIIFINAFAANDRDSTEIIWQKITKKLEQFPVEKPALYALINHRSDRAFRLKEFINFLSFKNRFDGFLLSGALKFRQQRLLKKNLNSKQNISKLNLFFFDLNKFKKLSNFFNNLEPKRNLIIFACGNIHGDGEIIAAYFEKFGVELNVN
ncbi:poly-gamma-glutamate synthase PgsB [Halanaerobium praevalens]|uniref:Mur ligase middle domain protein n=1 Tax=Halanaerobium praevalens (strain ATCC 33744 / DSM 2228 / GSL) TaxID=572479 RepID=E3DP72_HALPG|nr:poly-gamma-glutamate synthase PgsB [Halanaerobium praevalens]ADO76623.1 Mur ligase middle domain protein [Halanaerobium praevalens DSM 2228]